MKLTVIGSMGAYPSADNPSSGYLLQHDGFSMMLDFGSAVYYNLISHIDINDLNAVYLSHYHPDHTADIGVLQHAVKVQTDLGNRHLKLPIYGRHGGHFFEKLTYHDYTIGKGISAGKLERIGPFECEFLENDHPEGCLAVRIRTGGKTIVYTGDTGWYDGLVDFAAGCDLLLCETSLFNRFKGRVPGHLCAEDVGMLAKRAGVKSLALCHFPHFGDPYTLVDEVSGVFRGDISNALPATVYNLI